jgi:hypothetical protein
MQVHPLVDSFLGRKNCMFSSLVDSLLGRGRGPLPFLGRGRLGRFFRLSLVLIRCRTRQYLEFREIRIFLLQWTSLNRYRQMG